MEKRDKRTKTVTEALQAIRQIKSSAVEDQWIKMINQSRDEELSKLWQTEQTSLYITLVASIGLVLLTVTTLAIHSYLNSMYNIESALLFHVSRVLRCYC